MRGGQELLLYGSSLCPPLRSRVRETCPPPGIFVAPSPLQPPCPAHPRPHTGGQGAEGKKVRRGVPRAQLGSQHQESRGGGSVRPHGCSIPCPMPTPAAKPECLPSPLQAPCGPGRGGGQGRSETTGSYLGAQRAWPSLQAPPHQPWTQRKTQSCWGLESAVRGGEGVKVTGSSWPQRPLVLEAPKKPGNKSQVLHCSLQAASQSTNPTAPPPEARVSTASLLQVSKPGALWAGPVTAEVPPSAGFELRSHLNNPGLSTILP